MEIKSSTSIICVPNLKEIEAQFERNRSTRRWFSLILKIFLFWCEEEEKYKENRVIFESEYLINC